MNCVGQQFLNRKASVITQTTGYLCIIHCPPGPGYDFTVDNANICQQIPNVCSYGAVQTYQGPYLVNCLCYKPYLLAADVNFSACLNGQWQQAVQTAWTPDLEDYIYI